MEEQQEVMEKINYFSRDSWLKIREETGFGERVRRSSTPEGKAGRAHCYRWVEWMHQLIKNPDFKFNSARTTGKSGEFVRKKFDLNDHVWLEAMTDDGKRYIADGTAGQSDPNYFDGFYGTFDEASHVLQRIYEDRQIWKSIFENKS